MTTLQRHRAFLALAAATVVLTACAGRQPRPQLRPPVYTGPAAVVKTAQSMLGVPYRLGGADPRGFDCSGLVYYAYSQHGVTLPREVRRQWTIGLDVSRRSIQQGDLLFFATTGKGPTHVTLAIDRTRFIHAPSAKGVVRIESLSSTYWSRRFLGARRVDR